MPEIEDNCINDLSSCDNVELKGQVMNAGQQYSIFHVACSGNAMLTREVSYSGNRMQRCCSNPHLHHHDRSNFGFLSDESLRECHPRILFGTFSHLTDRSASKASFMFVLEDRSREWERSSALFSQVQKPPKDGLPLSSQYWASSNCKRSVRKSRDSTMTLLLL